MSARPIPPVDTATDPIDSPADLCERWRALLGELGFRERLLRITFVGPDRRMLKVLTEVEIGSKPHRRVLDNLVWSLREVLSDMPAECTVAFLLTRPGRGAMSDADRSWAREVTAAARRGGLPIEPFHRANDDAVVLVDPQGRVCGEAVR
jgi:hypothetical protein